MRLLLNDLQDETLRLAKIISVPVEMLPKFGDLDGQGIHVTLNKANTQFVLSYVEKRDVWVALSASDREAVLERIFVDLTDHMASVQVAESARRDFPELIEFGSSLSYERQHKISKAQTIQRNKIQIDLLGAINPVWQQRQSEINASLFKSQFDQ